MLKERTATKSRALYQNGDLIATKSTELGVLIIPLTELV